MNYYFEDGLNVRRNMVTVVDGGGPVYNAVLSVKFEDIDDDPLTLQEVKDFCSIDGSDSDSIVEMLIPAAREICEGYANLSFTHRTVTARIKNMLGGINLPYGPVDNESLIIMGTDESVVDNYVLSDGYGDELIVEYEAGYQPSVNPLPAKLKLAWLNQILHLFDNRGSGELSPMAKAILKPLRNVS